MEISNTFVVVLGVGVVFTGLLCIVILCKIVSAFCNIGKKTDDASTQAVATPAASAVSQPTQNRQEIIAAVSACIAEELGTDISAIRILSFKKI